MALVLALLNFLTIIVAIRNPNGSSYPKAVAVEPEKVDYNKITEIVKQQLALLPKPKNGANGVNGSNGANGKNGADGQNVTAEQIAQAVSDYLKVNPPPQGEPGAAGKTPELRCVNGRVDMRFVGEIQWQPLLTFAPLGVCL